MKKKYFFGWLTVSFLIIGSTLNKPAYIIYNKLGKQVEYGKMIQALDTADIILFGEIHNNALVHWLELQMLKSFFAKDSNLIVGAEMFEADDQIVINEYLKGVIELHHVENEIKVWNNYKTDYQPLLSFAKQHDLPFVATNVPRRYASLVARKGIEYLDSLSDSALAFLAPLPVFIDLGLPGYRNMLHMKGDGNSSGHGNLNAENMAKAQALKDATMAYFISQNFEEDKHFIHFNGSYHSDNFEGIYWYLKRYKPDAKIATVSCVEVNNVQNMPEEHQNVADYVIAIPEDMTKTY